MCRDQLYKIGLPGKLILGDYFQENMTSRRPFLLLRISFLGRPIVIQFIPADDLVAHEQHDLDEGHHDELRERAASIPKITNCDS